jgi:PPP family 3-phenylpropionic acid transporter
MQIRQSVLIRILYFLVFCCTASWLPVLADYCNSQGLTGTQTSLVLSMTPIMMFAVQPFYGMLADKVGYKKSLLFASLFSSFSYVLYLFGDGFAWILLATFLMSVFYNTIQPILDSLSLRLVEEDATFSYGTLRVAGALGWSVTGIIIGQLIDQTDISWIFLVSAISMALFFVFSLFLQGKATGEIKVESISLKGAFEVFKNAKLVLLLFSVLLVSIAGTSIWNFYSMYMKENGASAALVGYGLSLQGLFEIPFFYFSAWIISRLGMKTTLLVTVLATAFRLILYSITDNPNMALPIEVLHGISWSLFWVICVEWINKLVDTNWLATGQSLLYAAYYGAGAILGNYWAGFLSDTGMRLSEIFLINAALVAFVFILIAVVLRTNRQN